MERIASVNEEITMEQNVDNLIQILNKVRGLYFFAGDDNLKELAKHLIKEGVKVPDKVNLDKVWVFYTHHPSIGGHKNNLVYRHLKIQTTSFLINLLKEFGTEYIKIVEKSSSKQDLDRLGRLAFGSQIEAEIYLSNLIKELQQ